MSTYNGERFLREQIDSLYEQKNVDVHILVRDDGSKDTTLQILQEYLNKKGNINIIVGDNVGPGRSFFELAQHAGEYYREFDYYCFCDQDDVWLPEKLSESIRMLKSIKESNKLYIGRARYVDKDLNLIGEAPTIKYYDYKTSVYRNPALGCTMVFDMELLKLFNLSYPYLHNIDNLHDAWLFKCANFLNSSIVVDSTPHILYRQHGSNVTDANKSTIKKYVNGIKRRLKRKNSYKIHASIFFDIYKAKIVDTEKFNFLKSLIEYDRSLSNTMRYLNSQPWQTENKGDRLLWKFLVLLRLF